MAQAKVGSAVLDGQDVSLYSDGTWSVDKVDGTCRPVAKKVSFCGTVPTWTRFEAPNAAINAQYRYTDSQYAQYIVEGVGAEMGLTVNAVVQTALVHASNAMNVTPKDIPVISRTETAVDGVDATTVVYLVKLDRTDITFANTIIVRKDQVIQAQSYTLGASEYDDRHRDFHTAFLDLTELGE